MIGKIHSFESFGTVDGPGIRFVVFLKGCPLRCMYCHNPDTWTSEGAELHEASEVCDMILKYKNYFANGGGVTVTGGEPLVQIDFVIELFTMLKKKGIHTCCDTSGFMFDPDDKESVEKHLKLIEVCDLFLLDIKHIDDDMHIKLTGKSNKHTLAFAEFLEAHGKHMWIRHVLVPGITTDEGELTRLHDYLSRFTMVDKVEVLPYHTMGVVKYKNLGIPYRLEGVNPPTKDEVLKAKEILEVKKYAAKR